MASVSNNKGYRRIQFIAADGIRKGFRLGKVSAKLANEIKLKVESLNSAIKAGMPIYGETATWLGRVSDDLADKLAKVGLIQRRENSENEFDAKLGGFTESYIAGRTDHKPATTRNCQQAQRSLMEFFGPQKPLGEITAGDADDFAIWLRGHYAKTTAARRIKWARAFFKAALRKELIPKNPFEEVKVGNQVNKSREQFVSRETVQSCIEAAPDAEWRLILALARYGGIRTASETLALKLEDINWERDRIRVPSPKTEHHEGHEFRFIPIFAELRPYLLNVCELAQSGEEHLITRYRDAGVNLRTQFLRIIRRAGESSWPRLFHNLR